MISITEAVVAGIVLAVEVAAVWAAGRRFAAWFAPDGDPWDRALAGLAFGLGGATAITTVLGLVGLLRPGVVPLALVVAAGVVLRLLPDVAPRPTGSRSRHGGGAAVAIVGAGVAALYLASGLSGTSTSVDTNQYHVPNLGFWVHAGSIWRVPFAQSGYATNTYPSAYEVVSSAFLAGRWDDRLLYLTVLPWVALGVVAVAVTARTLGSDVRVGALAGLAAVSTPLVVTSQAASLKPDLASAAGLVAAVGLLLGLRDRPESAGRIAMLAGLALGVATASKYAAFGPAVAVVALAALLAPAARRRAVLLGMLAGPVALTGAWLLRNAATTGNPLFPLALGPLAGVDSPLSVYERPLLGHLVHRNGTAIRTWADLAWEFVGPAVVLMGAGAAALLWGPRQRRLVALVAIAFFVSYTATPFTGGGEDGVAFLIGSQLRYALPALLLGAALAPSVLRRGAVPVLVVVVAWNAWRLARGGLLRPEVQIDRAAVAWAVVLLVLTALWQLAPERWRSRVGARALAAAGAVVVAGVAAGALLVQGNRPATPIERALREVGRPTGPVAVVFVGDVRSLMGPDLDVQLINVNGGGANHERALMDPTQLDAAVDAVAADVLAVDLASGGGVFPADWTPGPGWRLVTTHGRTSLFARVDVP